MKKLSILVWMLRFVLLVVLFNVFFMIGAQAVSEFIPNNKSEPGLLSPEIGLLVISVANTLLVIGLILSSRWRGKKLILTLSAAYYGAVTFMMQIESWYFLSELTVPKELLPRLFIMGIPVACFFIPAAVWILGRGSKKSNTIEPIAQPLSISLSKKEWIVRLLGIIVAYIILYWGAGYFIAWQNPELRAFYGSPGAIQPFWVHTLNTWRTDPELFPFQMLRALLWALCAIPVVRGSKLNRWHTAILVGVFFSIPQNIGHILENPLMPIASVRLSHMVETASSTFVFGVIITWLLYPKVKIKIGEKAGN